VLLGNDERLIGAACDMDLALALSTGLDELSRKKIVYFTLATHVLALVRTFPQLVLLGKMGTGKSETAKIISKFARAPRMLSLRNMTLPTIRDALAECEKGTAIIEEADYAWKDPTDFERLLSDRYQRDTAQAAHKVSTGKDWETVTMNYFGATVLHRRLGFNDAALDGRSIVVRFKADHSRQYREFDDSDPWITEGSQLVCGLNFKPPAIEQPPGVAARIFNTYRLLLGVAQLCGDDRFSAQIVPSLIRDTAELSESQSAEPDGLVLRSVVEVVFRSGSSNFRNIKLSELVGILWNNHRWPVQPRQVGSLARELGFETKPSHGVTVVVPTPAALVRACDECGYTENAIEELRKQLLSGVVRQR
jgi:hypothetical protein